MGFARPACAHARTPDAHWPSGRPSEDGHLNGHMDAPKSLRRLMYIHFAVTSRNVQQTQWDQSMPCASPIAILRQPFRGPCRPCRLPQPTVCFSTDVSEPWLHCTASALEKADLENHAGSGRNCKLVATRCQKMDPGLLKGKSAGQV